MAHGPNIRRSTGTRTNIIIFIVTFISVSCSVKEMREACPCRVGLDFSELLPVASPEEEIVATVTGDDGKTVYRRRFGTDTCDSRYEILLPKGLYTSAALLSSGEAVWMQEEEGIRLREGFQADSLYGQAASLDAMDEEAGFIPKPLKQFATLFILFPTPVSNLRVEMTMPSSFINTGDLSARESPFAESSIINGESGSLRLPRQTGRDISITFFDGGSARPLAAVDLAPLLQKNGYDFNAPELADIYLTMDFGTGKATIEVEGWKESFIIVTF